MVLYQPAKPSSAHINTPLEWHRIEGMYHYDTPINSDTFPFVHLFQVVHRHCDKTDASLSDKCRFEILTCYEGRQYLLVRVDN